MRLVVIVKTDSTYKKIEKMFSSYEVLANMPIYMELLEFVIGIGDESVIAIIEESIHWSPKAAALLAEYNVPFVKFNGNFDDLEAQINPRISTTKPDLSKGNSNEDAGLGIKEDEAAAATETSNGSSGTVSSGGGVKQEIIYVDREVTRYVDREVIKEVPVEKVIEVPVVVEKVVEVPVEKHIKVQQLRAMSKKLIVIGSLYSGAGSSFVNVALAKVLDSIRVDTTVMEYPAVEPYLHMSLDGTKHLPRDYTYIFPQIMQGQDTKKRTVEWRDGLITWMPSDPANGKLTEWTSEHMTKCLYAMNNAVTILDISTAWADPALHDVILQADHVLIVAGPEPARLLSSQAKMIKNFLKKHENYSKMKVIANFVPDSPNPKTQEWIRSLPAQTVVRVPGLPSADVIDASWRGGTVFDDDKELISKFTDVFFPLIRQIVPKDYLLENPKSKSIFRGIRSMIGGLGRS